MPDNTLPTPNVKPLNPFQPGNPVGMASAQQSVPQPSSAAFSAKAPGAPAGATMSANPVNSTPTTFPNNPVMNASSVKSVGGSAQVGMKPSMTQPPVSSVKPNATVVGTATQFKASTPPPSSAGGADQPKKSILRFLPFLLLGILFVGLLAFGAYWFLNKNKSISNPKTSTTAPVKKKTIVYWGLWEPTTVMQQVLSDFEKANPEYQVQYTQQSYQDYRERLQAEISKGSGPDVFRFHASWVPMLKNELSPLPEKIMTKDEFSKTFYPTATQQLTLNGNVVGIPLMIDGLGLYYNKDIFTIANKTPPKDWEELKRLSQELTIKSGGKITRGGIAMGTASNVEHFPEIIALLMLQNGANPANPTSEQALEAISFYLDFSGKLGVWDTTLPNATVAFAKGDVAMMLAPSWRAHEVKSANPNLQFDVVPVPQLADKPRTTWASFWAEGVNAQSSQKEGSWLLLKYLSSADVEKKLYADASNVRAFGELYSRVDLADEIANKQYVGAFIQDAPYAKSWYLNAYTHDNGINDRIIKYYLDMVNAGSGALTQSTATVSQGMNQVLGQYGVGAGAQQGVAK